MNNHIIKIFGNQNRNSPNVVEFSRPETGQNKPEPFPDFPTKFIRSSKSDPAEQFFTNHPGVHFALIAVLKTASSLFQGADLLFKAAKPKK